MSTTNPDDLRTTVRQRLVPFALPIAIVGILWPFVLIVVKLTRGGTVVWTFGARASRSAIRSPFASR